MERTSALAPKLAFCIVCVCMICGVHWPPRVSAQRRPQQEYNRYLSAEDARQDERIEDFDERMNKMDKRLDDAEGKHVRMYDAINKNASDVSGIQGEERGIGALLLLLQIVSLVQTARSKKNGA